MTQLARQHLVSSIEPRGYRTDRNAERFGDLVVREALDVYEQDGQSKLWGQLADRALHRFGHLSPVIGLLLSALPHHCPHLDLGAERNKTTALSVFVGTGVGHDAIKPGCELRILMKLINARKQLKEDLLRYIVGHRLIAAVMKCDRVDAVLMSFKQIAKGLPIALFTSFYDFSLGLAIAHYCKTLHKLNRLSFHRLDGQPFGFLPCTKLPGDVEPPNRSMFAIQLDGIV